MVKPRPFFPLFAVLSLFSFSSTLFAGSLIWTTTRIELSTDGHQDNIETAFHFKNTGADNVTILDINSSCGCTTTNLDKKTYASGEEGDLQVKFTFGEFIGTHQKEIVVTSSDTPTQPTVLVLQATIPEPFLVEPRLLTWKSEPMAKNVKTKSVTIVFEKKTLLSLTKVLSDNALFETRLVTEARGRRYRILVTPKSLAQPAKAVLNIQIALPSGRPHLSAVHAVIE